MNTMTRVIFATLFIFNVCHAEYKNIPGHNTWFPAIGYGISNPIGFTTGAFDATGEKISMCGKVKWLDTDATKDIRRVTFRFGSVVKAGGSDILFSLRDINPNVGPPLQPDLTDDQTYVILDTSSDYVTYGIFTTDNLSSDRTVSQGEYLCGVWQYDGARAGSDSAVIGAIATLSGVANDLYSSVISSFSVSATWTVTSGLPNLAFEFSDGTYGIMENSIGFIGNVVSQNMNSGSTPDERALSFWNPYGIKIDGMRYSLLIGAGSNDSTVSLYEGTTLVESVTISSEAINTAGGARVGYFPLSQERTLTANTTYYISFAPNTTNSTVYWITVPNDELARFISGGRSHGYSQRTNGGAWDVPISTQQILGGYRITEIDTGGSSGGGTRAYPFFQ